MVIVMPSLTESDDRHKPIVAAVVICRKATFPKDMGQRVDRKGHVPQHDRRREETDEQATPTNTKLPPQFRKEFPINKSIRGAYLYISGLGQFNAYLNGAKGVGGNMVAEECYRQYRAATAFRC